MFLDLLLNNLIITNIGIIPIANANPKNHHQLLLVDGDFY